MHSGVDFNIRTTGSRPIVWNNMGWAYSATSTLEAIPTEVNFENINIINRYQSLTQPVVTGVTVASVGTIKRKTIKVQIAKEAWTAASTTETIIPITVPLKSRIVSVLLDTTTAYAGLSGTISLEVGDSGSGDVNKFLVSHDVKSAAILVGDLDADLGVGIIRASAIQGGFLTNFTGSGQVTVTLTSGTGNIGTGSVTNLSAGVTDLYVTVETME